MKVTFAIPENSASIEIYIWQSDGKPPVIWDDYELVSGSTPLNTAVRNDPEVAVKIYPNPMYSNC